MRRTQALVCGVLAACTAATAFAATASTQKADLAKIEKVTSSIRQLKPRHPVKAAFPTKAAFKDLLLAEMKQDNPDSEIDLGQREAVLLGLLKPTDDLKKIYYSGLSTEVAGFYDYHKHVLYVPNVGTATFGVERYTIAHEYTHALQDQYYHLGKLLPDLTNVTYRNSDAVAARHALTEGDAVNLQNLFIQRTYSAADIRGLISYESHISTPKLPKSIQREFYFPYTTGVGFVERLYANGGMAAVNAAYHRLPRSTYEIMHPAAYLKKWKPVTVSLHHVHGFESWKQTDDDVSGAFGYNLVLWQYLGQKRADRATDAYRGDRYVFLENGDQKAMLMKSVWTSARTARAARAAFLASLHARFPALRVSSTVNGTTAEYAQGAVYLAAAGKRLTVAYAPTAQIAQSLGTAATD